MSAPPPLPTTEQPVTSLPPPALTNPVQPTPQQQQQLQASQAASPSTLAVPVTAQSSSSSSSSSSSASSSSSSTTSTVSHTSSKDAKVSNVPVVFLEPNYINKPSQWKEDMEADMNKEEQVPGHTMTSVPHMVDSSRPHIQVSISNNDLRYHLQPSYLGSSPPFVYYNASDVTYYKRILPNPLLTIWILIKNTSFVLNTLNNVGYVKRRLVEEALQRNVQIRLMNPNEFDLAVSQLGKRSVVYRGAPVALPDAVIPRVGANVDYFGLAVLRQLEALGVSVFNPVNAIEISRDKLYTHQILSAHGLPIPQSVLCRVPLEFEYLESKFQYPMIVKLASGSRGEAVWKVDSRSELTDLMGRIDKTKPIIIQEFLAATQGRDLRCLVVGDRVIASCMRVSGMGSFKANFHAGGSVLPVTIPDELAEMVVSASKLCGLTFSGVDVLLSNTGYVICEVNSSPGFEGLERASQINCGAAMIEYVMDFCAQQNKLRQEKEQQQQGSATTFDLSALSFNPASTTTAPQRWRAREREYLLQPDHLEIVKEAQAKAKAATEATTAAALPSKNDVATTANTDNNQQEKQPVVAVGS